MTPENFHRLASSLPGTIFDTKFRGKHVYSVGRRMFASIDRPHDPDPGYRFKASEMAFTLLTETGLARPAPYLALAGWVLLAGPDVLTDGELSAYITQAHALVQHPPGRRRTVGRAG